MSLTISLQIAVNTGGPREQTVDLFSGNITGNLCPMWHKAGCQDALYDSHGKEAAEIVPELLCAMRLMTAEPEEYRQLNPSNGWGDYEGALQFLASLIEACVMNPKATIRIWK